MIILKLGIKIYVWIKWFFWFVVSLFYSGEYPNCISNKFDFTRLIKTSHKCLELGPFNKPLLKNDNVKYFDVLDKSGLIQRAQKLNLDISMIPEIDFVSPNGDLKIINDKFDVILSSHVIEHQPDLIDHLKNIERILTNGGKYLLIIPDRRYTFDYFIQESNLGQIIEVHVEKRQQHRLGSIIEHRCLTTHNNPYLHLLGMHGKLKTGRALSEMIDSAIQEFNSAAEYIDVHAWYFTPAMFSNLITQLFYGGFINLTLDKIYETVPGQLEFFAILRKN